MSGTAAGVRYDGANLAGGDLEPFLESLVSLSIALLASLTLGRMASRWGVPRVTAYLLAGFVLGPHVLLRVFDAQGPASVLLLGEASATPLHAVEQLAIGFILFGIGAEFRLETFRRVGHVALVVSGCEISLTALLVAAAAYLGTGDLRLAAIAPALAIASAPSATLVTLREIEAEGPVTRALVMCVGHNNLAALLVFPLLLSLAFGTGDGLTASATALAALAGGAALGLVAAVVLEAVDGRRELVLVGVMLVLATLGLLHWAHAGATGLGMLGCFGAGLAVANASPHAERLQRYVENTVYPLYVLFFIGVGRDLHVEVLPTAGMLGVLFVLARAAGKLYGARLGLRLAAPEEALPRDFGKGLMCQAGVALGLVSALEGSVPAETATLRQVVVASVVVFEIVGPWLVRRTVVAAGEVKLANLVPHAEATGLEALRWVALELRRNIGAPGPGVAGASLPTVGHVMRRSPATLLESDSFARVMKRLAESHADLLPVLDAEGRLRGILSYDEVKSALYDPMLRNLVIAGDLTTPVSDPFSPDTPVPAALEQMDRLQVHSWPVVEDGRLVGVMRRSDAYGSIRRGLPPVPESAAEI